MYELLLQITIGWVMPGIITYVIAKHMTNTRKILENLLENDDLLSEFGTFFLNKLATDQKFQQSFYLIGGLIGKGAKDGMGLGKGGRKMDLMSLVGMFLEGKLGKTQEGATNENPFKL